MNKIVIPTDEYKEKLKADLILLENALLNYPNKEKKIKSLMRYLNKKLDLIVKRGD